MPFAQPNLRPNTRQLRQFGGICLFALPLIGWIWSAPPTWLVALAAMGVVVAVVSWLTPRLISPLFIVLMLVTIPIGMVVGELAMLFIFFFVFLPIGCVFKTMRRDRLQLQLDRRRQSYWEPKKKPNSVSSYFRQS